MKKIFGKKFEKIFKKSLTNASKSCIIHNVLSKSSNNTQKWRNWQTRRLQVPVVAISCGFKSHLLHFIKNKPVSRMEAGLFFPVFTVISAMLD